MARLAALLSLFVFLFASPALAQSRRIVPLEQPPSDDDADGLIVRFRSDRGKGRNMRAPSAAKVSGLAGRARLGLTHHRMMSGEAHVLRLERRKKRAELAEIVARLKEDPDVLSVDPDYRLYPLAAPTDPYYGTHNWSYQNGAGGARLPAAWDVTTGNSSQVIAVLDTGILGSHADMSGKTVQGYDFITSATVANDGDGRDSDPTDAGDWLAANECGNGNAAKDSSWHGSHVAGTIAAATNNGAWTAGVNWSAKILPIRVLGKCGGNLSDIVDGMRWAAGLSVSGVPANQNPAKILNMSLGGRFACNATYQNAIDEIVAAGSLIVVAAANANEDVSLWSPASCTNVITVAATGPSGEKASYSNYGTGVTLAAPGGNGSSNPGSYIWSTFNTSLTSPNASPGGDTIGGAQGTSQATPHVAGIASLLLALNGSLTPAQLTSALVSTVRAFPTGTGSDCNTSICGAGILDGAAAVAAVAGPPPSITSALTATGQVGQSFSYTITATNSPTSFSATGLPAGLSVNASNGQITGTPSASGTSNVTISASNLGGSDSKTLVITVNPATPAITSALTATGDQDQSFSYTITASNSPTSYNATGLPTGLSVNTANGQITGTPTGNGVSNVTISATNAGGTGQNTLVLTIRPPPPSITSALTATGQVGQSFTYTIAGTNSPTSFSASPLPAGLSVNTANGQITGTPTTTGVTNVTIGASNSGGSDSKTLVITVNPPTPVVTSALTATGDQGQAFSYTITASNSPTSYNATGLPAGLNVNTSNGQITGTPSGSGVSNVTISATNAGGTGQDTLVLTVRPPPPVITSALTAQGNQNVAFAYTIAGTNNPTSFSASGLPNGLSVNTADGQITGTPTGVGVSNVTIGASNAGGSDSKTLVLTILEAPPAITSALTATGDQGQSFSYQIAASNSPTSYNAAGLPAGLSVNTVSGLITGTPTGNGVSNVTLSATNGGGTGQDTLVLTIRPPPPVISSALTAQAEQGVSFSYTIAASNSPTSFNATGLPNGLSVNTSNGAITGAATDLGTTGVTISATNAGGSDSKTLTLTVVPPMPVITSALTAAVTVNTAFSYTITATNSPTSYNATNLPAGLSVNTANGAITGTPTLAATTNVTISATNANGTREATLVLTVHPPTPVITSALTATAVINQPFNYTIAADNTPTSFNATGLPAGLSVNTSNGTISGTATGPAGSSNVSISATNFSGTDTDTLVLSVVVVPAPDINSLLTAEGVAGQAFSYTITATNSPTSYSATGLPAGLSLDTNTGVISGTPAAAGTTTVTIGCANGGGSDTATLTIIVYPPPPAITSALTASGGVGQAFSYAITATNSPTSYGAQNLPTGLSLNSTTGLITGTPAQSGARSVTISASNSGGTGTAALTITVLPAPPVILSALTATAVQGQAFSYTISASNGPTSYNATGLPAGLSINTANGAITGTPTSYGSVEITLSATNVGGTGTAVLTLTIQPPPPAVTSALTADASVGQAFAYTITGSNTPTSYGASGLPAGLSVNASNGQITGTPTASGGFNVTITATNAGGSGSATLALTVHPPAPVVTSALTATGSVGQAFSYGIAASNSPTSYNATGLPAGLSVNTSNGAISGTPTTAGAYNVQLSAANFTGTGTATLALTVLPQPPVVTSALTASGSVGQAFTYTIAATNTPTSFNATNLPAGLAVSTSLGLISGTPTAQGVRTVTLSATNAGGTGTASLTLTVNPAPPVITSAASATGRVGQAFAYTIAASNSPTSFSAGALPAGLSFNSGTGAITGTPTTVGVTSVALGATNAGGTGTATLTITINPGVPAITSALTAAGAVNQAFSYQIAASNSPASFSAAGLPAGLTVNTVTGLISGTPTSVGTTQVTLGAANVSGTGSATLALTVTLGVNSPVAAAPTGVTASAVTANWSASDGNPGGTEYYVEAALDPAFISGASNSGWITARTRAFSGLTANTPYHFRVKARSPVFVETAFVSLGSTRTLAAVPVAAAAAGVTPTAFTANWSASDGNPSGTEFMVERALDAGFTQGVMASPWTNARTYDFAGVAGNTVNYLRVRARSATGTESAAASLPQVTTPAQVPVAGAAPLAAQTSLTAYWSGDNAADTEYLVERANDSGFTSGVVASPWAAAASYAFTGLSANTRYHFRVRARDRTLVQTANTTLSQGVTLAAAPSGATLVSVTLSSITVDIPANAGFSAYRLEASPNQSMTPVYGATSATPRVAVDGLSAGTTYYLRVASLNQDGALSYTTIGSTMTIPATSSEQVTGGSQPTMIALVPAGLPVISNVQLQVPANAFPAGTRVTATTGVGTIPEAKSNQAKMQPLDSRLGLEISAEGRQPNAPVMISLTYDSTLLAGADPRQIQMARYSPEAGQWVLLPTSVDTRSRTITAYTPHFSLFAPFLVTAGSDFASVQVFPQPWEIGDARSDYWAPALVFANLPASANVTILTITGERVWQGGATPGGVLSWDGSTTYGGKAASGTYLVLMESGGRRGVRRVVLVR